MKYAFITVIQAVTLVTTKLKYHEKLLRGVSLHDLQNTKLICLQKLLFANYN